VRFRALVLRWGVDALLVVLAVAAQVELFVDPTETAHAVTGTAALFWTLPLLLRRRFPLGVPVVVFVTLTVESFLPGDAVVQSQANILALLAAFTVAGTHPDLRAAFLGAAIGCATIAAILLNDFTNLASFALVFVIGAAAWAVGRALSERARRTAELELRADRLQRAHESAVADERARIARELHDVIAHSVSVMTVRAGAARLLLDQDPARARQPLLSIEDTGRQALADMRRLLGILRSGGDRADLAPQPGMADVAALVEQVRLAGLSAELNVHGKPKPLPPGTDLTAYRVVQEALTNALKHATPARARVDVRYGRDNLELAITNDGRVDGDGQPGHGLVGMRERVVLYGGTFKAGPDEDGGYQVRAELPLDPGEP
jgi:signal transduction histidine kinase